MATTVVWFRRDLRIEDNPALIAAARAGSVVPVFVWSPEEEGQFYPGRVSRWWLKQSLMHLDASLRALGSSLIMRSARSTLSVLVEIIRTTGATQLFYNHLYDPVSLVRDHKVKQSLGQLGGITVHTFNADLLYEPWEVYDDNGQAFTTYDSFWNKSLNMPFEPDVSLAAPKQLTGPQVPELTGTAESLGLEDHQEKASNALLARAWVPGWANADRALEAFLQGPLLEYATNRSKTDSTTTSLLSPHMHFGEISVRKIYHEARRLQILWKREGRAVGVKSVDMFLRSLGYREYSRYLSFNFPFTHERSLLANLKSFPWRVDEAYFKTWRQGRTGYPLVDAGMRELWATGWLHNRVRVVVSSFCVKFLQLPWRWGMKYFWDTLMDADLECDVLGWQYISGSLPDGHELDRMEIPEVEGYRYDPEGEYVRRWLPELSRVPTEWIHHPWDAPPLVLRAAGVELGVNYPRPIVQLAEAREHLQESLSQMWEREAALKAALANGVEEGLGETVEVAGTGGADHEKMEVHTAVVAQPVAEHSLSSRRDQLVPSLPSEGANHAAESILRRATGNYHSPGVAAAALAEGIQPPSPEYLPQEEDSTTSVLPQVGVQGAHQDQIQSAGPAHYGAYGQRPLLLGDHSKDVDVDSTAESSIPHAHMHGPEVCSSHANTAAVPVWSQSENRDGSPSRCSPIPAEPIGVVPSVTVPSDGRRGSRRLYHTMQMSDLEAIAAVASNKEERQEVRKRRRDQSTSRIPPEGRYL